MQHRSAYFCSLLFFAATTLAAVAEPTAEELTQQRHKLEAWRKHPEQLARLRQDLQAFLSLPPERRERIVQLDQELHNEKSTTQARLWGVLERYADWLERQSEKDRQAIKQAPDKTTRLALIRELRDQEWMRTQPRAIREAYSKLVGDARGELVRKLRDEERQRQQQWQLAARFWRELEGKETMPCRLSDFSTRVQKYVHDYLLVMISDAEKQQLSLAEGRWPDYPQTLVEIASKHPAALPPRNEELPRHFTQLPAPIQQRVSVEKKGLIGKRVLLPKLQPFDGSPTFASKVVEVGTNKGKSPFEHEFWASHFRALQPPMKDFVENKLLPALKDNADKKKLSEYEGLWPYYPQTIQELAEKHHLRPPWFILPEADKYRWDQYRDSKLSAR